MRKFIVKAVALSLCLSSAHAAAAPPPLTPVEQAAMRAWVQKQASDTDSTSGFLLGCKNNDGKFFTTRTLGPDCVVHEQLGPFNVLSDTPTSGWRKVLATANADYYLDDSSFSYVDAQAKPKPGNGVNGWLKVVYHQPQAVAHSQKKELFTTMITSVEYGRARNTLNYEIQWLYGPDGNVVDAYPPSPAGLVLQPQNAIALALAPSCKVSVE
jgi:opacity protein-like surface antigen